ncbi:MAG: hypothetical protein HZA91_01665 [Verrucomicrobia bacterium]|nr:hypothetical protein [Verrucomicrobiota bacterium]
MEFIFNCPHCQRQLAAEEHSRGQTVACPACQQALIVPASSPAAADAPGQEEIVEVLDEFRPPASPVPPLAHPDEPEMFSPATVRPGGGRRRPTAVEGVPPVYVAHDYRSDRVRYRGYDGLYRRTQFVVAVVAVLFCSLLAVIIYLIGRPPGEEIPGFNWLKPQAPPQTNAAVQLEVARLTADEQKELLQLTLQAFSNLSPEEGKAANLIYSKITQKQYTTDEQRQYFNVLFQKGVLKLPPAEQQRLRQLFAKTVVATP